MKRDLLVYSVNVKLIFEFFVMREKAHYFYVKLFSEEVFGTLYKVIGLKPIHSFVNLFYL